MEAWKGKFAALLRLRFFSLGEKKSFGSFDEEAATVAGVIDRRCGGAGPS